MTSSADGCSSRTPVYRFRRGEIRLSCGSRLFRSTRSSSEGRRLTPAITSLTGFPRCRFRRCRLVITSCSIAICRSSHTNLTAYVASLLVSNSFARWFTRLRDAYLEPWGHGLNDVFDLAIQAGHLAHPIAWARQREFLLPGERATFDDAFAHVLRRALRLA